MLEDPLFLAILRSRTLPVATLMFLTSKSTRTTIDEHGTRCVRGTKNCANGHSARAKMTSEYVSKGHAAGVEGFEPREAEDQQGDDDHD